MQTIKIGLRGTFALSLSAVMLAASGPVSGAVSEERAERLGSDELTRFGAPREGSEDGVIPPYSGGLDSVPEGIEYRESGDFHPDPFPDDEIRHTVTAQNMDEYEQYLTTGTKALLETYPDTYKINVYPTRRTAARPDWVVDNMAENAVKAELVEGGDGIDNAYGGIPFPILHGSNAEHAQQAIWNHKTAWRGIFVERHAGEVAVETDGNYNLTMSEQQVFYNFYNPEGDESTLDNTLFYYLSQTKSPARLAGGAILVHETLNQVEEARRAWGYNAGQRRVRRAPNLAYDSPIAAADNLRTADETDLFNGAMDRYNWQYLGLKQFYVPYNNYAVAQEGLAYDRILGVKHVNPKLQRWERHRVHVVEANLKEDERHIFSRRVFYIDADSWKVLSVDQYDGRGELWRVSQALSKSYYEVPTVWTTIDVFHDLQAKRYHVQGLDTEERYTLKFSDRIPNRRYFSPQALRRQGRR